MTSAPWAPRGARFPSKYMFWHLNQCFIFPIYLILVVKWIEGRLSQNANTPFTRPKHGIMPLYVALENYYPRNKSPRARFAFPILSHLVLKFIQGATGEDQFFKPHATKEWSTQTQAHPRAACSGPEHIIQKSNPCFILPVFWFSDNQPTEIRGPLKCRDPYPSAQWFYRIAIRGSKKWQPVEQVFKYRKPKKCVGCAQRRMEQIE